MEEGIIAEWFVQEGGQVAVGDQVCSIEIEKLTNDLPAPVAGVLRKILVGVGYPAPCGAPIAIIAGADEDISALLPAAAGAEPDAQPLPPAATSPKPSAAAPSQSVSVGKRAISPKAAQLAEELGVAWEGITGTGRLGMITRADVQAASITAAPAPRRQAEAAPSPVRPPQASVSRAPGAEAKGVPPTGPRRIVAQRMMESLRETAQSGLWMDADVTELMEAYRRTKKSWKAQGLRLSVTVLILRALSVALKAHPVCRTRVAPDGSLRIVQKIDIAVAVDTPAGLLVPVMRDVDQKSCRQITAELTELAERARMGTLTPDEMSGHTMTVSNLGMYGVTYMNPLLNLPESVLLGVGASSLRAVYRDGGLFPREILPLSLTFDHRLVDGGPAAAFLRDVCQALSPSLLGDDGND
jgi:pyruvate dehydrogenase E2 component (dihydrolipoamide acetyltransferase)